MSNDAHSERVQRYWALAEVAARLASTCDGERRLGYHTLARQWRKLVQNMIEECS